MQGDSKFQNTGSDAGFLEGGVPLIRSISTPGGEGPALGPMFKSLHRGSKGGQQQ